MEVMRNISTEWIQSLSILYSVWFSHKRNHLTTLFSMPGLQVTFIKYSVSFVFYIKEKISLSGFKNTLQQFLVSKQNEILLKTACTFFLPPVLHPASFFTQPAEWPNILHFISATGLEVVNLSHKGSYLSDVNCTHLSP